MTTLEPKIDRLIALLEEQEAHNLWKGKTSLSRDLIANTLLASVVGYFIFRILDCHFRNHKS